MLLSSVSFFVPMQMDVRTLNQQSGRNRDHHDRNEVTQKEKLEHGLTETCAEMQKNLPMREKE